MKNILFCFIAFWVCTTAVSAQDGALFWKYKDYDGALAFRIPAFVPKVSSLFVKGKEERRLLRRVGKVRILVFQDNTNPISERDLKRLSKNVSNNGGLDDLLFVREGKTRVQVMGKEHNGTIKKMVVLVSEEETFALISVKGRLKFKDIQAIIDKETKKALKKGEKKPKIPAVVKPPVERV
jgi:hypothetical protein